MNCNSDGICSCKIGYIGDKCDSCASGYYYHSASETCQEGEANNINT